MQPVYARGDDPLPGVESRREDRPPVGVQALDGDRAAMHGAVGCEDPDAGGVPLAEERRGGTLVRPVSAGRYETLTIVFMPGAGIGSVPVGIPSRTV